jgi:hypothetical protein
MGSDLIQEAFQGRGACKGQRCIIFFEYAVAGRARSQRAKDTRGGWLMTQPEDGRGYLAGEDVPLDFNRLDELRNGIHHILILEDVVDYSHARCAARVTFCNAGNFPLCHSFGQEAPGVAKLDKVFGGMNKEMNTAPILRMLAISLLVLDAGLDNSLLVVDKGGRRHGYNEPEEWTAGQGRTRWREIMIRTQDEGGKT